MMLKKAGIVTVGVSAALLAASPMAFAGNSSEDSGHKSDDHGHHKHHGDHGDHGKGHGKDHGVGNTSCKSQSGDVKHNDTEGILALGPILDGNSGQLLSCNSMLNGNFSNDDVNVLNF